MTMPRPIILGIVGDSAAGKTTLSKGLVSLLGEEPLTHVCTDDYHKYDRKERAERKITPLDPECNYIDIMAQHLRLLRHGDPILKPVYKHCVGTFGAPVYTKPAPLTVLGGLPADPTPVHPAPRCRFALSRGPPASRCPVVRPPTVSPVCGVLRREARQRHRIPLGTPPTLYRQGR